MDYEKKYKEAVGILEFLIGLETVQERGTIQVKDIINTFPELKSHNDERIRKSLISVFTTHKKDEMYYGTSVDEILEWLDRQEEQKPAELPKGEDYGIDGLYVAVDILQKTLGNIEGYQSDDGILEHKCAINAVKKLYEQNPAWSKEDESIVLGIEQLCNCASLLNIAPDKIDKIKTWLKSLKDRIQPQNTWKPSDKQMKILWRYAEQNNYNGSVLTSLYNDLKKLREE